MGEFFNRVIDSARGTRGVSVEVGKTQAAVDLAVKVPCSRYIPNVSEEMRNNATCRAERLTGRR